MEELIHLETPGGGGGAGGYITGTFPNMESGDYPVIIGRWNCT